ncbi:E3 ubiquitin-protein ligase RBBP6-like isoform X3 [Ananas comosus]|uniref:E3 ubiquitin-protein ligase RBBP6-like isoform X3 n=1 Tax=Ananas comosus TaxID=4615 RepID=A0A6P5G328_ANACO|nr:E3 ubiquitin-protein ligase RBBP6-like isoform X3 [Ananas comosus]
MAVRFKFRSSAASDTVDLGGAASISVRDLRSQILRLTNPRLSRDFDLLISDPLSNRPYDDEELQIPAGSEVIIKRVPTGRSASSNVDLVEGHELSPSEKIDVDKFDDFRNDLNPLCEALLPQTHADIVSSDSNSDEKIAADPRCSEISISRHQNIKGSDLEIVGGNCSNLSNMEEDKMETQMTSKIEEHKTLDEGIAKCSAIMLNIDPPMELRCSLCSTIYKEAVMIPCCQHSFCDKCIRCSLVEIRKCPKCSSTKCTVEDLLPNLSLRQAIEHFLEAQKAIDGSENLMPKYAPDGESGIQAKEPSYAVSIRQQELQVPYSPAATGKGSNQIVAVSIPEKKRAVGISIRLGADKSVNANQINLGTMHDENSQADKCKQMAGFQERGNSAKLPQNLPHKVEANFPIHQRKGLGINAPDGSGAIVPPIKPRKGERNCYMCGSPDHLIRDCPVASNTYPGDVAFPGQISAYGPPFWCGSPFPNFQPYASMYAPPGIMPYDSRVLPGAHAALPSYMPPLYGGMSAPYSFMRTGGFPYPVFDGSSGPFTHADFRDPHGGEQHHKIRNEGTEREFDYDDRSEDYHPGEIRRETYEQKHQSGKQASKTFSDDDKQRVLKKHQQDEYYSPAHQKSYNTSDEDIHGSIDKKHGNHSYPSTSGRDRRSYCSEKSISEVHNSSEYSTKHGRERSKHHNRSGSKKHGENKGKGESGFSKKSHRRSEKERTDHKKQRHKYRNHSDSLDETDFSKDHGKTSEEKEVKESSTGEWFENDRWEMADGGLEDDYGEEYYRKRKRTR